MSKQRTSIAPLAVRIAATVALYAAGEIKAGSLAPKYEQNCRCAPSFKVAKGWVPPNRRYCAKTVAAYMGVPCDQTFQAALSLLAAHEAGVISQEVFDAIVSGELNMSIRALRELAKRL
jgi:hypothetical protein